MIRKSQTQQKIAPMPATLGALLIITIGFTISETAAYEEQTRHISRSEQASIERISVPPPVVSPRSTHTVTTTTSAHPPDDAPVKIADRTVSAPPLSLADAKVPPIAIFTDPPLNSSFEDRSVLHSMAVTTQYTETRPAVARLVSFDQMQSPNPPSSDETAPQASESNILSGDPEAGQRSFAVCRACHSVDEGRDGVGPSLFGLIGRQAGSIESFNYSPALKDAEFIWSEENLDKWLKNSTEFVPGNRMGLLFRQGVQQDDKRADIIAYLASL